MRVYRVCEKSEIETLLKTNSFESIGHQFKDNDLNTHKYENDEKYIHFVKDKDDILFFDTLKGRIICEYEIPDDILKESEGKAFYKDYLCSTGVTLITEYAVKTENLKLKYIKKIYLIKKSFKDEIINNKELFESNISEIPIKYVDSKKGKDKEYKI